MIGPGQGSLLSKAHRQEPDSIGPVKRSPIKRDTTILTSCKTEREGPASVSCRTVLQAFGQSRGLDAISLHQSHHVSTTIAAQECGTTGGVIGGVIVTMGILQADTNSGPAGGQMGQDMRTSLRRPLPVLLLLLVCLKWTLAQSPKCLSTTNQAKFS